MSGVYTDDDLEIRVAAIRKCQSLVDIRLRQNYALRRELEVHGKVFIKDYCEQRIYQLYQIDDEAKASALAMIEEQMIKGHDDDLIKLHSLRDMLQNLLDGVSDGLPIVFYLIVNIAVEEEAKKDTSKRDQGNIDATEKTYKKACKNHPKNHPEVIAAKSRLDKFRINYIKNRELLASLSDITVFEEVKRILSLKVFSSLENDFMHKYVEIIYVHAHDQLALQFNDRFRRLVKQNETKRADVILAINERHEQGAQKYKEFSDLFQVDPVKIIDEGGAAEIIVDYISQENFFKAFRDQYTLGKRLDNINKQDAESIAEELLQLKLYQEEQRTKAAAAQSRCAEQQQLLATIHVEDAQTKDVEQEQIAAEQKFKQQEAEEVKMNKHAEMKLERIKLKEGKAAEQAKKEVEKRRRHKEFVANSAANGVMAGLQSKIVSSYTVSPELVIENAVALQILFDEKTDKYRYTDIKPLVGGLGGSLNDATKSSHQIISFKNLDYQAIELWHEGVGGTNTAESSVKAVKKASIVRPHGKDNTFVRHNNLQLFRDAIESILPPNWKKLLQLEVKPSVAIKNSLHSGI